MVFALPPPLDPLPLQRAFAENERWPPGSICGAFLQWASGWQAGIVGAQTV